MENGEVKEIKTIRELLIAVEKKHGLDALHYWEANNQALSLESYKKYELLEMILGGTKPITDMTIDDLVEGIEGAVLYEGGYSLKEAAEMLGDLAEGLLPTKPDWLIG